MRDIKESDWKIFRKLHPVVLERYCQQVLKEAETFIANPDKTAHERYLELYTLMRERDKTLATAFNDMRRSTALGQIGILATLGLLTDEELDLFSPETRNLARLFSRNE